MARKKAVGLSGEKGVAFLEQRIADLKKYLVQKPDVVERIALLEWQIKELRLTPVEVLDEAIAHDKEQTP